MKQKAYGYLADDASAPLAPKCWLLDDWSASVWTKYSAIADLTKGTHEGCKDFVDMVSTPGTCFQEIAAPLLGCVESIGGRIKK
jgi:hypothetical protein